jgi:hypothetical protein
MRNQIQSALFDVCILSHTDPQIHSIDGKGYGIGNIGQEGMRAFMKSHKCNKICESLRLPPLEASLFLRDGLFS